MKIEYEWCYEIEDENGDIIDNNFADRLSQFGKNEEGNLVLVRNEGDEIHGLEDRFWAYVKGGKLAEYFQDGAGEKINIKVPQKFHKELKDFLRK